ncbi:MAG: hypothetical protein DRP02_02190 [Candidatus Gerdarchaeota archaeon]|nr:MAG: hypothetical protein DRP02_02190 [Candidatus Gerdarchaeota archaeon]
MESLKQKLVRHAKSAAVTFFSTFALSFFVLLQGVLEGGEIVMTSAILVSLLTSAALTASRAVVKLITEKLTEVIAKRKLQ